MFFNYRFLSLSLALIYFSMTHSMNTDHLPQEHQEFLQAIRNNKNINAERILRENPTININLTSPDENIPYAAAACYDLDNDYMLKLLIDKGLDTTNFGQLLHDEVVEKRGFNPKVFKILVEYGALKQLTPKQQLAIFNFLLFLPAPMRQDASKCALDNGLDITTVKQYLAKLFKILAYHSKRCELNSYSTYATHSNQCSYSLPNEQTTKEYVDNNRIQALASYRAVLDALKKSGLDFTFKTHDYKELLGFLTNEGTTDLAQYLILHNGLLSAPDLETIIAHAQAHYDDPTALSFIDNLADTFMKLMGDDAATITDQQKAVIKDILGYLKQQWRKHKNKSIVKLLRRFTTIQRLFNSRTTPEIAHKIAQYDIADFQDTKLDYLPSYDKVQELIAQKMLEHT